MLLIACINVNQSLGLMMLVFCKLSEYMHVQAIVGLCDLLSWSLLFCSLRVSHSKSMLPPFVRHWLCAFADVFASSAGLVHVWREEGCGLTNTEVLLQPETARALFWRQGNVVQTQTWCLNTAWLVSHWTQDAKMLWHMAYSESNSNMELGHSFGVLRVETLEFAFGQDAAVCACAQRPWIRWPSGQLGVTN